MGSIQEVALVLQSLGSKKGAQQGPSTASQLGNAATRYGVKNYAVPWAKYATGFGTNPTNIPKTSNGALATSLGLGGGSTSGTLASGPIGGLLGNYLGLGTEVVGAGAPVVGAEATALFPSGELPAAFAAQGASEGAAGAAGGAGSLASMGTVYAALPAIASLVGSQLQKSGSPQVRGTGRSFSAAGQPVEPKDFKHPFNAKSLGDFGKTLLVGGPAVSAILKGVGFDPFEHKPTSGTQFRGALHSALDKADIKLKDYSQYSIDPKKFADYDPAARADATALGKMFTQGYKTNPEAYGIQTQNLLMNNLTPQQIVEIAKRLKVA